MSLWIYSLVIKAYGILIRVTSLFNSKAKKWVKGRKNIWPEINRIHEQLINPVWIHAASLGEFEQGRPVIEEIKRSFPDTTILLTFFSPSGYEIRKDYKSADRIFYLPLDTPKNAQHFIEKTQPKLAIFIKYDFWFNYLDQLTKSQTPFFFISAVFNKGHFLFQPWAKKLLNILRKAEMIFVQNENSHQLLIQKNINSMIAGDNRIDRVIKLQDELKTYPYLLTKTNEKEIIIFGSIWLEDLEVTAEWINQNCKRYFIIIAPHDVSGSMQKKILQKIKGNYQLLSQVSGNAGQYDGMLVDTIGDLAHLYQYGHLAYIGGGFGKGIHSILEPVAAGLPVIFGPNYNKFPEASTLIKLEAAKSVTTPEEFVQAIAFYEDEHQFKEAKKGIETFLQQHQGATLKVVQYLASRKFLS